MKTIYREWLSLKLRLLMNEKGLSIREMARRLEMNHSKFRSYVEKRAEPSNLVLKRICKVLSTSMDNFMQDCPDEEGAKFLPTTSES
jgi:transcriptional regulator with XRE-family HTH domain